jgi:dTDP-4-amino-4,6-dideoxygalactose transaminase
MPAYICDAISTVIKSVCKPVYVDINSRTFNIDPDQIEKNITPNTKGILVAHLYGNACELDKIIEIVKHYNLQIIEDCAQSLGGTINGKKLGSFGDFTICSFRFSKDITSFKGGALITNMKPKPNGNVFPLIKAFSGLFITLTAFGLIRKIPSFIYASARSHLLVPFFTRNASMFNISDETLCNYQCSLLYKQFTILDMIIELRRRNAAYYSVKLADAVNVPIETIASRHTYYRYTIQVKNRDDLCKRLLSSGIEVDKMYNYSLANLTNSHKASMMNLNIPVHHKLSNRDMDKVIKCIHEFN